MKKITLLLFTVLSIGYAEITAQILHEENSDGLTVGNVGSDITGATSGQGGLLTFTNSGQNSDFQIVSEGSTQGNVLQITGSSTDAGDKFLWKEGIQASWASRDSGNNIIEIEFDFYTGSATTSKNVWDVVIYDETGSAIAGFEFEPETKILVGLARYESGGSLGFYGFYLGANNTDIVLAADTWYKVGCAFNKTTGDVTWKSADFYSGVVGAAAGTDPVEVDYINIAGNGNTVSSVFKINTMTIEATATEDLLGINDVATVANTIKLYPNPVNDILTLSMSENISLTKLEIVDINGRLIKSISAERNLNNQIDTSELTQGLYLLNIYSESGKLTSKFIKN